MFPFGCAPPGKGEAARRRHLAVRQGDGPLCLRTGTSAPARRQKLGHRLGRCEGHASGRPDAGHEARLQGQPSKRRTGQGNLVTRGRVTTATPAELDFKPPAMGGVEGCADTMSAGSSFSMDLRHGGFNAGEKQRHRRHPQHWPDRGLCVSRCSTAFGSGEGRLTWAAPVSPRSTCAASRDSSTGRGVRAAIDQLPPSGSCRSSWACAGTWPPGSARSDGRTGA